MNRVRPEAPSFFDLMKCFNSKIHAKIFRKGSSLCAGYKGCSVYVERRGRATPGGVKLIAKNAKKGKVAVKDERRAMLYLYGKDLFDFELVSAPCEKGYVLVYWEDVLLGLGLLRRDKVLNLLDFGDFLRRGY